ncbi:MAG: glycosyltransferase N-terminal domain-containing protein [Gemmatimonadales bacterium]|jgi:3-deoxy-D-manno-octulosonic-acid transferase
MKISEVLYDWSATASRRLLPHAPFLSEKAKRSLEGRHGLLDRIEAWAVQGRTDAPLVWFHAPSVGEGLQTRPVIEALRELRPDLQVFYTFFSPSAEKLAERMPADYADYMPFDVVPDLMRVMDAIEPGVVVYGKLDVWPNITRVAYWRGVPQALVSGTLAANSSRLRWPARRFLSPAYGRLDAVGAISVADATRLTLLGARADRIQVTGDARFDQVWARAQTIDPSRPPVSLLSGHAGLTLVAGSTWPEGERHIVPAVARLRLRHPDFRLVVVPHEPAPDHLSGLEALLAAHGLEPVRLSQVEEGGERAEGVVVVDAVGVLGELYGVADMAYVGGGFGRRGLHSVLEPAALGAPVLFGPRHANAREAGELIERGGAKAVADAGDLEAALCRWLEDPAERASAGAAALNYVKSNLGAGRRNAELILDLLEG